MANQEHGRTLWANIVLRKRLLTSSKMALAFGVPILEYQHSKTSLAGLLTLQLM